MYFGRPPHYRFVTVVTFTPTPLCWNIKKILGDTMRRWNHAVAFLFSVCLLVGLTQFASAQQDANESHRKMTSKIVPLYPPLAHGMNLGGTVRIEAVVAANGTVKSASILGGHPVLGQSALDAVRRCKWEPSTRETRELIILNFHPE